MTRTARLVGYARVSTADQNTDLQIRALRAAGCRVIHQDKISGTAQTREGLDLALASIGHGEKLVVWKLDRLGRSIPHVMTVIAELQTRGASLISLTENFDTGTEAGELYSTILALFAHVERRMISQRTRAGLRAAKERGVVLGRKRKLSSAEISEARALLQGGEMKAEAVAERYGVARATLFRNLKREAPALLAA